MAYFDNNATTKIDPAVLKTVIDAMNASPVNPSSITKPGRQGKTLLLNARQKIASFLQVNSNEIIFTSSATESNNLLISSFYQQKPGTIITTKIEHLSLLRPIEQLEKQQTSVIYLPTPHGALSLQDLKNSISPSTSFIALSSVNSETGCKHPIKDIAAIAAIYNIPLIIDAVASLGKEPINFPSPISALSFSAHKCHGPLGISIAVCKKPFTLKPLFFGGIQEDSIRPGTENLPAILGFAQTIQLIHQNEKSYQDKMLLLRNTFESLLLESLPEIEINGQPERICNVSNIYFKGCDAEALLINLDQKGLIASLGSACSSGALSPSHVLLNMGYSKERALSSIRFSFSRFNTLKEIHEGAKIIISLIKNSNCLDKPTDTKAP